MSYQEGMDNVLNTVHQQQDYLYDESVEIREDLERISDPLLEWTTKVWNWLIEEDTSTTRRLCRELEAIEGLDFGEESISIDYNVEHEMDRRTSSAMEEIREAVEALSSAVDDDPLMAASDHEDTAPVVDLFRAMAVELAPRFSGR